MPFALPRPFPVTATLLTALGLIVLCGLGHWQQERLMWKEALQARLDKEFSTDAALIKLDFAALAALKEPLDLRRGSVSGKLDFSRPIFLSGQIADGKPVRYTLFPLRMPQGTIFVVAGWADEARSPSKTQTEQDITLTGTARIPRWNSFSPPNLPEKNQWYRADTAAMAAQLRLPSTVPALFYPDPDQPVFAAWHQVKVDKALRNDHAQYALFWYTMAAVLGIIYVMRFWRQTLRSGQSQSHH